MLLECYCCATCKCSVLCVCVCMRVCMCVCCGFVYAVNRLCDLSGETESVYANAVKQPCR